MICIYYDIYMAEPLKNQKKISKFFIFECKCATVEFNTKKLYNLLINKPRNKLTK